jgi:CheY-like chemotaxis protein
MTEMEASDLDRSHEFPEKEDSRLLIVLPEEEDRQTLEKIVAFCGWTVYRAATCEEAILFAQFARPRVIVCDADLPDGGWRRIWEALSSSLQPSQLIVASRHADENLWLQVLGEGGHDVLLKPFCAEEVISAIGCAPAPVGCPTCCASSSHGS